MADSMMMPSGSGGIVRYNEEYPSKFKISPEAVVVFIAVIIVASFALKIFAG